MTATTPTTASHQGDPVPQTSHVDIFPEQLTAQVELVTRTSHPVGWIAPRLEYGLRLHLAAPPEDGDSSVTFWVPSTVADGHDFRAMVDVLQGLADCLDQAVDHAIEMSEIISAGKRVAA